MNQNELGAILKELRQQKGFTQKEIASSLIITPQTVSKWELGLSSPSLEMLVALAEMFGVSVDDLVKGTIENDVTVIKETRDVTKYNVVLYGIYLLLFSIPFIMVFTPYAYVDYIYENLGFNFGHIGHLPNERIPIQLVVPFDDMFTYLILFSTPLILTILSILDTKRITTMVYSLLIFGYLAISLFALMASPMFISLHIGMTLHIAYIVLLLFSVPLMILTSDSSTQKQLMSDWRLPVMGICSLVITTILPFLYNDHYFYFEELDKIILISMMMVSIVVIFSKYKHIDMISFVLKLVIFLTIIITTIIYIFNSGLIWVSLFMYIYVMLLAFTFNKFDWSIVNFDKIRIGTLYFIDIFSIIVYLYLITLEGDLFSAYGEGDLDIVLANTLPYGSLVALNLLLLLPPIILRLAKINKAYIWSYIPYIIWQTYFIIDLTLRYPLNGYSMSDGMFYYFPPILYMLYLMFGIKRIVIKNKYKVVS